MLRNMVTTLIDLEKIETTDAKAKELRSLAERLVTLAKRGGDDLAARRQVLKVVRDKKVVAKLFSELGPRYADRPGGYTRVVKVENRRGDAAPLSIIQFVTEPVTFKERKHKREEEWEEPVAAAPAPEPEETEPEEGGEEEVEAAAEGDVQSDGQDAEPAEAEKEGESEDTAAEAEEEASGDEEKKDE